LRLSKQQLNAICGPCRYPRSKEIRFFRPNRTFERQRGGEHRPVVFVSLLQSLTRWRFKWPVYLGIDAANQNQQLIEHRDGGLRVDPSLPQNFGEMRASLGESRIGSEESDSREVALRESHEHAGPALRE
jgi:hypothetical protein